MQFKIIDLDSSLTAQPSITNLIESGAANLIDARDFAHSTRIFARKKTIANFIEHIGATPENEPEITFYGSGDFHHLTAALVSRFRQPVTIIHFDNSPDWAKSSKTFKCNTWTSNAFEMPHVKHIITLGIMSDDLIKPEQKSANLEALRNRKLEVFPWTHPPSKVKGYYGIGASHSQLGRYMNWQNIGPKNWSQFLAEMLKRIQTDAVYISIDKSVLSTNEATTNARQGAMPLTHITSAITALAQNFKVIGVDICGDYSPVRVKDPLRWSWAFLNHPKRFKPNEEKLNINSSTNQRLINYFNATFRK
jgi:arginase family enzyme